MPGPRARGRFERALMGRIAQPALLRSGALERACDAYGLRRGGEGARGLSKPGSGRRSDFWPSVSGRYAGLWRPVSGSGCDGLGNVRRAPMDDRPRPLEFAKRNVDRSAGPAARTRIGGRPLVAGGRGLPQGGRPPIGSPARREGASDRPSPSSGQSNLKRTPSAKVRARSVVPRLNWSALPTSPNR